MVASGPALLESEHGADLGGACDGSILVIRHDVTLPAEVEQARELLERAGGRIVGAILTDTGDLEEAAVRPAELRARLAVAPPAGDGDELQAKRAEIHARAQARLREVALARRAAELEVRA